VPTMDDEGGIRQVLVAAGCEVAQVRRILPSLEDVFIERLALARRERESGVGA